MTTEQKNSIEQYREEFKENCNRFSSWGSERDCSFSLYKSKNSEDLNYTMVVTSVTGLSDDLQTYVETVNLMVEPDGNVIKMADVFEQSQVVAYVEQLEKID